MMDCHVHIHRGSAYVLSGADCRMGVEFPGNNSLSDILLLCFGEIRKKIEAGMWETSQDEMCVVDKITFEALLREVKQEYGSGFSKLYREMPEGEFIRTVTDEMEQWMFLKKMEDTHQMKICPLVGKLQGSYPKDFAGKTNEGEKVDEQ